jgi:hypothetical protein
MTTEEKLSTQRKIWPSVALLTKNTIWTALGLNLGLHSDKVVINCLSDDAALFAWLILGHWKPE